MRKCPKRRSPRGDSIGGKHKTWEAVCGFYLLLLLLLVEWLWQELWGPHRWIFSFFSTAGILRAFDMTMDITDISKERKWLELRTLHKLIWITELFSWGACVETVILGQHWGTVLKITALFPERDWACSWDGESRVSGGDTLRVDGTSGIEGWLLDKVDSRAHSNSGILGLCLKALTRWGKSNPINT